MPGLSQVLGYENGVQCNRVTVCMDPSECGFVAHTAIAAALKANQRVCVVSLTQTVHHYAVIGKKLGVNIPTAQATGRLTFIDCVSSPCCPTGQTDDLDVVNLFSATPMDLIVSKITKCLAGCPEKDEVVVVLDGFAAVEPLGIPFRKVISAYNSLVNLCSPSSSFVLCAGLDRLSKLFAHSANVFLTVQPLASGHSVDVHGAVTMTNQPTTDNPFGSNKTFHYRVKDNGVELFAPGTAQSLL